MEYKFKINQIVRHAATTKFGGTRLVITHRGTFEDIQGHSENMYRVGYESHGSNSLFVASYLTEEEIKDVNEE